MNIDILYKFNILLFIYDLLFIYNLLNNNIVLFKELNKK